MTELTKEQLVQWIRDETLRRFDAEERDAHVPAYRVVVLEALSAAEARGAAREREAIAAFVEQWRPAPYWEELIYDVLEPLAKAIQERLVPGEEGSQ